MIIDLENVHDNSVFDADVTIVGTGPAGTSLAISLERSGLRVNLLEGGGEQFESNSQEMYRGRIEGKRYYDLDASRVRMFGGTSTHWAGNCRELSPIDFEPREWVANSGWPICYADIQPYYMQAAELLKINKEKANVTENWETESLTSPSHSDMSEIWVTQFAPLSYDDNESFVALNFGKEYKNVLQASTKISLFFHANLTSIQLDSSGNNVDHLVVKTLNGKQTKFLSKHFVIAMGGIENARILLASNEQLQAGIGNQFDNVGRYFMEHIEVGIGSVLPSKFNSVNYDMFSIPRARINESRAKQYRTQSYYTFAERVQEENRILSSSVSMGRKSHWSYQSTKPMKSLRALISDLKEGIVGDAFAYHLRNAIVGIDDVFQGLKEGLLPHDGPVELFGCGIQAEQEPQRKNRVTLLTERDALNVPKIQLHWALSDNDLASVRKTADVFARELGISGTGRFKSKLPESDEELNEKIEGAWHHMGTTRMSDKPESGVVDRNCKVFGTNNLFVAGSSVFPTGGHSVPTYTIVALSLRLAEHLKGQNNGKSN